MNEKLSRQLGWSMKIACEKREMRPSIPEGDVVSGDLF